MEALTKSHAENLLREAINDPHASFRSGQWEAIERVVVKRSRLLVVQSTGWGKSIIYFIATKALRDRLAGPTLLVSPLLALMRNQIEAANRLGLRAETVNSSNTEEWKLVRSKLEHNEVDILLISPERLANQDFREKYLLPVAHKIGMFVVDEAHCISDWGHDFRPDYRRIIGLLRALPSNMPVLATTATANDRVVNDVITQMGSGLEVLRGSLERPSLALQNVNLPSQAARLAWLAEHIPELPGSGIVYTLTVKDAITVAEWLGRHGVDGHAYYGDLPSDERDGLEQALLRNHIKSLVATTALGMGFDKPDLGFVVHFQRPGSVVHYFQQVGRAGRAIDNAYGIMLSGDEDEDINEYFIRSAFPPMDHVKHIIDLLEDADDGLSVPMIEARLNMHHNDIEKALRILAVEQPPMVTKLDSRWFATAARSSNLQERVERLQSIRLTEQERMRNYLHTDSCLMQFLRSELDDRCAGPCGRCANCTGHALISNGYSEDLAREAVQYLRRTDYSVEPRALWPKNCFPVYQFQGRIPEDLRMETGRALCLWADEGWGKLVKAEKQQDGHFSDSLVSATADMIRQRWKPEPAPKWVTCVPSLRRPDLVPGFARRLADNLGLPFSQCIYKVKDTPAQKTMNNSFHQAHNLDGAFGVDKKAIRNGPVLLIDDVTDSRWTMTVISALLRRSGAGPVLPVALALNTIREANS